MLRQAQHAPKLKSQTRSKFCPMKTPSLVPYLAFEGNCREAMSFYQSCLGGELHVQSFAGTPAAEGMPEEAQQGVLHARLANDNIVLLASDAGGHQLTQGNNIALSLHCGSTEEVTACFNKLSEGSTVTMPLAEAFWGATFGMLTDKFGIGWLLNYEKAPAQ